MNHTGAYYMAIAIGMALFHRRRTGEGQWIASLDRLCGGRFDFGIGVGWLREEFEALGVRIDRRGARTDEYLAALRVLWTDEEAEFHGEFVDFDPV